MNEEKTTALLRAATSAFASGDLATAVEAFSEDIVWKVPGSSAVAGTYEGREGLARFFGLVMEKTAGTATLELEKILVNDPHSVHFIRLQAERDGEHYAFTVANFGEQGDDGRVRRLWFLPDDLGAHDRLFA